MFCMARESAMAVQDQGGCSISNTIFAAGGRSSMDGRLQQKFYSRDGNSPKVRKPYTITKQRERWTEEEHKKFIEALKLYGRAWRRIEEHVGTKTAVQIRSHAQKFFSKVVRDSTASNMSAVEPIEIPPPRPKRKPVHPYPRKPVDDCNKGTPVSEQPIRSASPIFSVSERENQSPTSVLSAVGSDAMGSAGSNPLNGSLSPVSSPAGGNPCSVLVSEPNPLPEENGSPSPIQLMAGSILNEHFPKNSGLSPEDNAAEEAASGRCIKLFGRTVLVTDTQRPSSPPTELREAQPSDINTGEPTQLLPWNLALTVSEPVHMGYTWNYFPEGAHGGLSNMQFHNKNSNTAESGSAAPLPWWTFCRGVSIPFLSLHEGESAKSHGESKFGDVQEKEIQKERSWTGSNTGSMNEEENSDKNGDAESHHCRLTFNKEKKPDLAPKKQSSEKMSLREQQMSQNRSKKGFVPYKRCLSDRETQSSAVMGDEREGQRFRLCL